jgi:8-oxo-dGTP pyrophosphatase MutT (NUDIX family)
MMSVEDSLAELRCAVAVVRGDAVLLVQRLERGVWLLLGGRPHVQEGMASCARREAREETGLDVYPNRCALVLEVNDAVAPSPGRVGFDRVGVRRRHAAFRRAGLSACVGGLGRAENRGLAPTNRRAPSRAAPWGYARHLGNLWLREPGDR